MSLTRPRPASRRTPPPSYASRARSALAPVRLAAARARARPGRGLLVALGVAVATALLGTVLGGSRVTAEQTVRHALAGLPAADRALRLNWLGLPPGGGYASIDGRAVRALGGLGAGSPVRTSLFRETGVGGRLVVPSAIDGAGRWVRLTHGRPPRRCTPTACEVVQVGGQPVRRVDARGIHLVVVGSGVLRSALPFGSDAGATATADQHSGLGAHTGAPFLVAGSVRGLDSVPGLSLIYRTYGWTAGLRPDAVHAWDVDRLLAREARTADTLGLGDGLYRLSGPDAALLSAKAASRTSARRLLLVGGEAAALLLAFVLLAAGSLRADLTAEWRRLERRGARRGQLYAFAACDLGWPALAGVLAGSLVAVASTALVARGADLPAAAVLRHSLAGSAGLELAVACWLVATALLLAAARWPERSPRSRGLAAGDLVALAALGALILAAARGRSSAAGLEDAGADPLLPLLPLLVSLAAGVLVARLLGPALRAGERGARSGPAPVRLALLALARQPGRAALTASFLGIAFGLALFALSYRDTLAQGQRDQAAFAVPLDATVEEGGALLTPLQAAPLAAYRRLAGGSQALVVLRRTATVAASGTQAATITALGVPAGGLAALRGLRSGDVSASPAEVARRLSRPDPSTRLPAVPAGARALQLAAARRGDPVSVTALVSGPFGVRAVPLQPSAPGSLRGSLAGVPAGGRVLGLQLALPQSHEHEDSPGEAAAGTLTLGGLSAVDGAGRRHALTRFAGFVGRGGLEPAPTGGGVRLAYRVNNARRALLRPPLPSDGAPLPVLASPDVARAAGPGGRLTLSFDGSAVAVRVAAVAARFPTVDQGGFVLADEAALQAALQADDPGTGTPGELWLAARDGDRAAELAAALRRPPFDVLLARSRPALLAGLEADPLARGVLRTLGGAALLALVLAEAGLLLSVASDLRDERAELYDLEAQGTSPATLRRELRLRAAVLAVAGLVAGLAVGAVLSRSVVDLVLVSANAGSPQPPLVEVTRWGLVAAAAAAFALAAAAGVLVVTRAAFRGPVPRRPLGGLP